MTIADNGVGLPTTPVRTGLGTTVITALIKQIGATLNTQSKAGAGTTVTLQFVLPTVSEVTASTGAWAKSDG